MSERTIKFPEPTSEANLRAVRAFRAKIEADPEFAQKFLVKGGFYTKRGQLTKRYR